MQPNAKTSTEKLHGMPEMELKFADVHQFTQLTKSYFRGPITCRSCDVQVRFAEQHRAPKVNDL